MQYTTKRLSWQIKWYESYVVLHINPLWTFFHQINSKCSEKPKIQEINQN